MKHVHGIASLSAILIVNAFHKSGSDIDLDVQLTTPEAMVAVKASFLLY